MNGKILIAHVYDTFVEAKSALYNFVGINPHFVINKQANLARYGCIEIQFIGCDYERMKMQMLGCLQGFMIYYHGTDFRVELYCKSRVRWVETDIHKAIKGELNELRSVHQGVEGH